MERETIKIIDENSELLMIGQENTAEVYLYREYKKITGISNWDMEQWILPVAAARLMKYITDSEKQKLLMFIRKKLQCIFEQSLEVR